MGKRGVVKTKKRSCDGKVAYHKHDAVRIARQRFGNYHAYHCKFCDRFHVGHKPRSRRRR